MKYVMVALYTFVSVLCAFPANISALANDEQAGIKLLISQVKVKNDTAGYDEFIEIYNPTLSSVNLADYVFEYFNTLTPSPTQLPTKVTLPEGMLPANSYVTLAKNQSQITESQKSPLTSLSDSGGSLHLRELSSDLTDDIAWSSTLTGAVSPILYLPSASGAKSYHRNFDTENKVITPAVWTLDTATPHSSALLPIPVPEPEPDPEPITPIPDDTAEQGPSLPPETPGQPEATPTATQTPEVTNDSQTPPQPETLPQNDIEQITQPRVYLPLQITELLPNPASPATDADDEYVELYNPNDEAVDLEGYSIQAGTTFAYKHVISEGTLAPHAYTSFTSGGTALSLANSGGQARLLNPNNEIVFEVSQYSDAQPGEAWAFVNGLWQWTTTPTKAAENILTVPVVPLPIVKSSVPKPKTQKTTKTTAKAAQPKKTGQVKAATTTKTSAKKLNDEQKVASEVAELPPPVHPLVLAGVSGSALLYAGYEYRQDMANRLYKLRSYRAARRAARAATSGR